MSRQMADLQEATIKAQCKVLRMPMIAAQFSSLADQAWRLGGGRRRVGERATSARWVGQDEPDLNLNGALFWPCYLAAVRKVNS